jgi:hypothetical protein
MLGVVQLDRHATDLRWDVLGMATQCLSTVTGAQIGNFTR